MLAKERIKRRIVLADVIRDIQGGTRVTMSYKYLHFSILLVAM